MKDEKTLGVFLGDIKNAGGTFISFINKNMVKNRTKEQVIVFLLENTKDEKNVDFFEKEKILELQGNSIDELKN